MAVSSPTDLLQEGLALHRRGAVAEAAAHYAEVLRADPGNADAHYYLGMLSCQDGRFVEGAERARKSLANDPRHARAHVLLGRALRALGRHDEALASFDHAIELAPDLAPAHSHRADVLGDLGRNLEAIDSHDRALALAPDCAEDWFNRGAALFALGRYSEAISSFDRAITLKPDFAQAHLQRAEALSDLRRHDEALAGLDKALAFAPSLAEAWFGRGNVLSKLGRNGEAIDSYDRALTLAPGSVAAWFNRAVALIAVGRHNDAIASFDRAIVVQPNFAEAHLLRAKALLDSGRHVDALEGVDKVLAIEPRLAEAWLGRGNVLTELKRYEEALAACGRALALKPDLAEAWLGRGNVLSAMKQHDDAFAAYDRALALRPDLGEAWLGRAEIFTELARHSDAFAAFDRALTLKPDLKAVAGARLHSKLLICDWTDLEAETAQLLATIRERKSSGLAFSLLAIPSSPTDQLQCARRTVQDQPTFPAIWRGEDYSHDRIRLAYLSADFYEQPTAYLAAGLFEQHDKSRFEVTGISFGPNQNSRMRQRLTGAFEHFIDVRDKSDQDIAELVRRLEIDIAVDLMGFTKNSRLNVLARRPAPIQVNYLGYIGTMGAEFIDYVIADKIALPFDQQPFYTEKIVHLPECFLVTDDQQEIAPWTPSREEAGLPRQGFVFCSFNNSYKLARPIFELWMRLLHAVEGSVLWLAESNAEMIVNLRREAQQLGIEGERIVFAPRVALPRHLARQRLAGLFLDSTPYNAGATGAAALWSGVPLLTVMGETFVGRMAASMLHAVGLPELVTHNLDDYESLAVKLASEPALLSGIRRKLQENLRLTPLFDTDRFRRHIEQAYMTMVDIRRRGEGPRSFSVEPMQRRL